MEIEYRKRYMVQADVVSQYLSGDNENTQYSSVKGNEIEFGTLVDIYYLCIVT